LILLISWNADEIGIVQCDNKVKIATSRRSIRYEIGNVDHITMMLSTNAAGENGLKYFLFPFAISTFAPTSALSEQELNSIVHSTKAEAYMDTELFQQWLLHFVEFVQKRNPNRTNLLILDGHKSRLNVDTLVTAAIANLIIICLPSHLTHLLQPNDFNYNYVFKRELKRIVRSQILIAGITITYPLIVSCAIKALNEGCITNSIKSSFRHIGIFPFDQTCILKLIEREQPIEETSFVIDTVLEIIENRMDYRKQCETEAKQIENETIRQTGKKTFFSSKHAQVLTSTYNITLIRLNNDWHACKDLKAKELHEWVLKQKEFEEKDLYKPDSRKKTMKELHDMIYSMLSHRHEQLEEEIAKWIAQRQQRLPISDELLHNQHIPPQNTTIENPNTISTTLFTTTTTTTTLATTTITTTDHPP